MTKEEALYQFWSGFGIPAIEENSVPSSGDKSPNFPYISYQSVTDSFNNDVALSASIWDIDVIGQGDIPGHSALRFVSEKADEISRAIGRGGKVVGGIVWIRRGTPFAQNIRVEENDAIKRKYLNITAEFLTAD